jgi:hypothetical protein
MFYAVNYIYFLMILAASPELHEKSRAASPPLHISGRIIHGDKKTAAR